MFKFAIKIPLYHGTGWTVYGSPLSHLRALTSHCLSYPTVPWDRLDCPWESTVRPIPLYRGTGWTVRGNPLSHLRTPISHCPSYPTVPWDRVDCPWKSTVSPDSTHIPLYHGTGRTVHVIANPLFHLRALISHCPFYPTVPLDRWDCPWEPTVPPEDPPKNPLFVLSHCTMGLSPGSPLFHLRGPISHCPSYPTVPWDRLDHPLELYFRMLSLPYQLWCWPQIQFLAYFFDVIVTS